jgi:hypothetical protein
LIFLGPKELVHGGLHALVAWLHEHQVTTIALESTGVYWVPLSELLETEGFEDEQLQDLHGILQEAREGTEHHAKAREITKEVLGLLERFQLDVLPLGTAGRLLMSGDVEEVLPLDEAKLLEEARPIDPAGRYHLDAAELSARHDGQVQAALKDGPFAQASLGGAHDLTESLRGDLRIPADYHNALPRVRRE